MYFYLDGLFQNIIYSSFNDHNCINMCVGGMDGVLDIEEWLGIVPVTPSEQKAWLAYKTHSDAVNIV